jgi:hypothetical protein
LGSVEARQSRMSSMASTHTATFFQTKKQLVVDGGWGARLGMAEARQSRMGSMDRAEQCKPRNYKCCQIWVLWDTRFGCRLLLDPSQECSLRR